MTIYGYVELFAIGMWMLAHALFHLYPLVLSLGVLVVVGPMLSRAASRMERVAVEA